MTDRNQNSCQTDDLFCPGFFAGRAARLLEDAVGYDTGHSMGRVFVTCTQSEAMRQGAFLDDLIASGSPLPPLAGVSLGLKDNLITAGIPTTCASRMLKHFVPPYDSTCWSRLRQAGAILVGKTNLDEFGMGVDSTTSIFGRVENPAGEGFSAGGSSSGSAAAVAAGLCQLALGSDTGGSVRQPAAFCGVFGFKPTFGAISRYGLVAHASSLEQVGLLARDISLLSQGLRVLWGRDGMDATVVTELLTENPSAETNAPELDTLQLVRPRLGVCAQWMARCTPAMQQAVGEVLKQLQKAGAVLIPVSLPSPENLLEIYRALSYPQAYSNLARYQGIRFGGDVQACGERAEAVRQQLLGKEVLRRMNLGKQYLADGRYAKASADCQTVRQAFDAAFCTAFDTAEDGTHNDCDALLLPATATAAFPFAGDAQTQKYHPLSDQFLVAANLCGQPAVSIPAGEITADALLPDHPLAGQKLPFGVQLLGKPFTDFALLDLAQWVYKQLSK